MPSWPLTPLSANSTGEIRHWMDESRVGSSAIVCFEVQEGSTSTRAHRRLVVAASERRRPAAAAAPLRNVQLLASFRIS